MMILSVYSTIIMLMSLMMFIFPLLITMNMKKWSEKLSSFECGMNLNSEPRKPLSLRFFLLMVLFIIFDVEISMIMALPMISPWSLMTMLFILFFMSVLTMGLVYEWMEGSLDWKN